MPTTNYNIFKNNNGAHKRNKTDVWKPVFTSETEKIKCQSHNCHRLYSTVTVYITLFFF